MFPAVSVIDPDDRITYAEAIEITGRSRRYLNQQAAAGALSRVGGTRSDVFKTWLSRRECEQLALNGYRRGHATDYWLTMTEAAKMLGIARQNAHQARTVGRLPAQRTHNGDWLVRRDDVLALLIAGVFPGQRPEG